MSWKTCFLNSRLRRQELILKKKTTTTSIPTQAIIVWIEIARDSFEGKVANDVEDVEVAGENVPLAV